MCEDYTGTFDIDQIWGWPKRVAGQLNTATGAAVRSAPITLS